MVRYRVIGGVVVLALAAILIPVLLSLRDDPPASVHPIELPREPQTGMTDLVGPDGETPPGALPELAEIPSPAPPPPDLEPIPPPPPPVIPAPGSPAPAGTPGAPDALQAPAPSTPAPAPPPASSAAPQVAALPEPGSRPPPKAEQLGVQAYVVQVGTFANRDGAVQLRDRLKSAGFKAFTEETVVAGTSALRVRVGPELDRAQAERSRERIARELGLEGVVLRYQ